MFRNKSLGSAAAENGVALVIAMLVVALASILVATMLWREWGAIQRENEMRQNEQLRLALRGASDWAMHTLVARGNFSFEFLGLPGAGSGFPNYARRFVRPFSGKVNVRSGRAMMIYVEDLQSRFNLIDLAPNGVPMQGGNLVFSRLCVNMGLNCDFIPHLVSAVASDVARGRYLHLRSALEVEDNNPIHKSYLSGLSDYVTALPGFTKINVNTAPRALLNAILAGGNCPPRLGADVRSPNFYSNISAFERSCGAKHLEPAILTLLTTHSDYFLIVASIKKKSIVYVRKSLVFSSQGRINVLAASDYSFVDG